MFEKFTDRARKVCAIAQQEAYRFNHKYIGTEHLLLGLAKEGSGVGATVLKNLDIDLKKLRLKLEKTIKAGPDMVTMGKLPYAPHAKKVIEYSIEEARALGHNYVGTEHLLLGLLRQDFCVGRVFLTSKFGINFSKAREELLDMLDMKKVAKTKTEEITVNVYENGRVKSLQIDPDTSVGLFLPGEYTFTSERKEHVVLVQGEAKVKFPGSAWMKISAEKYKSFNVPENSQFTLKCDVPTAYICDYG